MADRMIEGGAARSDEAMLETVVPVAEIETKLAEHLHPMIASLFERFGVTVCCRLTASVPILTE